MTITTEQAQMLAQGGGKVFANDDDKVGSIGQIYLDNSTGEPTWVTVKTGLFGTSESFVPLDGAQVDGDDIHVSFDEAMIKDAPRVDPDRELDEAEEGQLYRYYGVGGTSPAVGTGDAAADRGRAGTADTNPEDISNGQADIGQSTTHEGGRADRAGGAGGDEPSAGHDTSGPNTDEAMTRSEEQLRTGTRTQESGKVRLRKYVVTENVTQTVPVQHEEVVVERESITDATAAPAHDGPAISEEEHEVTLHEEVPVVEKEAVPVERVQVGTKTVTDEATVSEDVRKEQIEMEDPDHASGTADRQN